MTTFLRDLRYALRSLGRTPALTAALLATVAVGIGSHATITGFVNGLLTRDLGLPGAADLAVVYARDATGTYGPVPSATFAALREGLPAFESLAAFRESRASATLRGRAGWMSVAAASSNLWDVLRMPAALGRATFEQTDALEGRIPVILAHQTWRDEFNGRNEAIGADVMVGGRAGRVVGVAPEWFEGLYLGRAIDIWVPFADAPVTADRGAMWAIGRLRSGSTVDEAQAQLQSAGDAGQGFAVMMHTGIEPDVQARFGRVKDMLGWAALLVFATAAANVAGFLLSRAARRSHETAARVALGAARAHLVSQIVADSVIVTAGGALLGGLVAFWTASALPALFYSEDAERLHLMPDGWQVAASVGAYAAVMMLCALAPLAQINQHGAMTVLRRSDSASATSVGWLRSVLVVAQMSVCVVLVIATALLFEGFRQALRTARGDSLGQPVVAVLDAAARYARPADGEEYFRRAEDAVARVPGVIGTAWIGSLPGGRTAGLSARLEQPRIATREVAIAAATPAGPRLLELALQEGRPFSGQDGPFSCRVALVNGETNTEYFGGAALGKSIEDSAGRRVDIVGLVEPKKRPGVAAEPMIYFFERQALAPPSPEVTLERFLLPVPPATPAAADVELAMNVASTGYFEAVGATFAAGRAFDGGAVSGACDVAVINREAADLYFGGKAVGGAVIDRDGRRAQIVGVVDAGVLHVMQRRAEPMVLFPSAQRYIPRMALIAATRQASPELRQAITQQLDAVPGGARAGPVITLDEHLSRTSLGPERIASVLVAASAAIALGLGLLGAYGVLSDAVRQRKREIALRLALGAQAWKIVYDVIRSGVRVAAAGAASGLAVSWLLVRAVRQSDPAFATPALWMWLAAPLALLAVVAVASVLPARWALAVDPLTITRDS